MRIGLGEGDSFARAAWLLPFLGLCFLFLSIVANNNTDSEFRFPNCD